MAIITRIKNWIDRECLTHTDLNAEFSNITDNIIASDLTNKGMIERATDAEVVDGTDEERAVTPAGMLARTGTTARIGLVQLEDSHTSVLTTKAACPKNVKEAYDLAGTMLTKATFDANTFIYAVNDNTPVIKTRAEVMALLSGQAGADFALNTHKITGLVDPTTDQEAATKKYVDDNIGSGGSVFGPATHSANYVPQWNGSPNSKTLIEGFAITAAGKAFLDDATAAAQRTTLGLGTAATRAAEDSMTDGSNLPDGHAVKTYGDANWSGGGNVPAGSQGDMLYKGSSAWLALDGIFNVKAYGAVGDGSTNDQAAIQLAVNAALNHSPVAGTVYFPDGRYKINTTINLTASGIAATTLSYFSMVGNSPGSSILYTTNAIPLITMDADYHMYYGTFADMGFQGTSTSGQYGIYVVSGTSTATDKYLKFTHFSRLKFISLDKGIYINRDSTHATEARIGWNMFENLQFGGTTQYGIHIVNGSGVHNVYIGGNYLCNTAGIKIDGTNAENVGDITFDGIQFGGDESSTGIYLNSGGNASYRARFTINGCQMDGGCNVAWNLNNCSKFIINAALGGENVPVLTNCSNFTATTVGRTTDNWNITGCSNYSVNDGGDRLGIGSEITGDETLLLAPASGVVKLKMTRATVGSWNMYINPSDSLIIGDAVTGNGITITNAGNLTSTGTCCPDYVFEKEYNLISLPELSTYIKKNESLPGITFPCGKELNLNLAIEELMVKTEEQALYILQLHERLKTLEIAVLEKA